MRWVRGWNARFHAICNVGARSLSDLGCFGCNGERAVHISPLSPYVESPQKVSEQTFAIRHRARPDTLADDITTTSELVISEIAAVQRPLYTAQKRSSSGSVGSSP